jgi:hypothetical protein
MIVEKARRVAVLAGRRPDALDTDVARFPVTRIPIVRRELSEVFVKEEFTSLVCAAACGADLLALEVAVELDLEIYIVLPFDSDQFRHLSVIDRPGDWVAVYDQLIAQTRDTGHLQELDLASEDSTTFLEANEAIIRQARKVAEVDGMSPIAIVVWDGQSRGEDDVTQNFKQLCQQADFRVIEISTL